MAIGPEGRTQNIELDDLKSELPVPFGITVEQVEQSCFGGNESFKHAFS